MTNLTDLTIAQALSGLDNKDFTATELVSTHIDAAKGAENLNCLITDTYDQAMVQAQESDARRAAGNARALDGIPIAMKDLFCTKGVQTTAASKILEGFKPEYESTVSQKLLDAGTISIGKANLDEFAMGSANTTSAYGNVINPWRSTESLPLLVSRRQRKYTLPLHGDKTRKRICNSSYTKNCRYFLRHALYDGNLKGKRLPYALLYH